MQVWKSSILTNSLSKLAVSTEQLYAFYDQPSSSNNLDGWEVYEPHREYARMGVFDSETSKARTSAWRSTAVNASYEYCSTYPSNLVVPAKISDATLNYGKSYRSKCRIPGLVYLHWNNLGTITRASQPMVGLKNARSIQDEKLIEAIFNSHSLHHTNTTNLSDASYISHSHQVYGATPTNLIIDARPTTNAMANVAKGAGTENMEHYRNCKKVYLGIDNIHVMRDSLARVVEAIRQPEHINHELLRRSGWLKHLSCILEGILIIVRAVHLANSHVLIHCSDGWDRTSQLSSLSQLCLDPYYRTLEGFAVLVEKDWISFGHHFGARCGHVLPSRVQCVYTVDEEDEEVGFLAAMQQRLNFSGSSHGFKETCPVFDQFLDCIHQLQLQYPACFEYNDAFLLDIQKQLYECKYGNFLYDSEKERMEGGVKGKTRSLWAEMLHPKNAGKYWNSAYVSEDREVLFPDPKNVKWWTTWFKRKDMNLVEMPLSVGIPGDPMLVDFKEEDPVLRSMPLSKASSTSSNNLGVNGKENARDASKPSTLQASLDSASVSQASTAVQGAVRSAWSAWKTVRQGYEGVLKDLGEVSDGTGTQSRPGSSSQIISQSNPIKPRTPQADEWPKKELSMQTKSSPETIIYEPVNEIQRGAPPAGSSSTRSTQKAMKDTEDISWNSRESAGDPLGVEAWS